MRAILYACAVLASLAQAALPPEAQAVLDRARVATPQHYQYALDQGVQIIATTEGRSFYLSWTPPGAAATGPVMIVTLHGHSAWAFDEFSLFRDQAAKFGYPIIALQWWFGVSDTPDGYYLPTDLHRELRAAVKLAGAKEGSVFLHGFSRGSSNIYGLEALDRQSGDRYYGMVFAASGGASEDFPPNVAITNGTYGYNVYSGTYWGMFCGGQDPNPDRDGCPAMRRTQTWVGKFGGIVDLFIQDDAAGHGGFAGNSSHLSSALDTFKGYLALRQGTLSASTVWQVRRDAQFNINDASIPNVGLIKGEVWLSVGTNSGLKVFRSTDGSNSTTSQTLPGLTNALSGTNYGVGEVIPREGLDGNPILYVLGLAPPNVNRSALFRLTSTGSGFTRNPSNAVFEGASDDAQFIGVPDVTPAADNRLRLIYVSRGSTQGNSRTATSSDGGASFTGEFNNPFGDLAIPAPTASDINVDPAVLKLARGGYLGIAMRATKLYLFSSIDGRTFIPTPQPAIQASDLSPGATGLFDPTLVQLPDGRVFVYATAGGAPTSSGNRVVRAELLPTPTLTTAGVANAASLTAPIAPGSIFSIFGENLAPSVSQAQQYPLPLELVGTSIKVGGRAAPLFYVSSSQINAQVPYETPAGQAQVEINGATTSVQVASAAPGLFKLQGDFVLLGTAVPGAIITLYLTGLGAVSPAVATGSAAPDTPLSFASQNVQASIGGKPTEVLFAGLAPRFAGLMQLNLRIPDLPPGDYPAIVIIGAASSAPGQVRVGR